MNSTPEPPNGAPQEPEPTPPVVQPEPVTPPQSFTPPQPVMPPEGAVPPPGSEPPQGPPIPPQYAHYTPPMWTDQPPQPRRGLGFGAWLGIGIAIGLGAQIIALVLMFATVDLVQPLGLLGLLWPFILVAVIAGVLMFFPKTRGAATGILIMCAAAWLLVIGPCIALLGGLGG